MLEVRTLTVLSQQATQRIPAHLPSGCTAICCHIQTAGKAQAQVVLGGPHAGDYTLPVLGEGLEGGGRGGGGLCSSEAGFRWERQMILVKFLA